METSPERISCFWCERGTRPLIDPVAAGIDGELFSGAVGKCSTPGCDEAVREAMDEWALGVGRRYREGEGVS